MACRLVFLPHPPLTTRSQELLCINTSTHNSSNHHFIFAHIIIVIYLRPESKSTSRFPPTTTPPQPIDPLPRRPRSNSLLPQHLRRSHEPIPSLAIIPYPSISLPSLPISPIPISNNQEIKQKGDNVQSTMPSAQPPDTLSLHTRHP